MADNEKTYYWYEGGFWSNTKNRQDGKTDIYSGHANDVNITGKDHGHQVYDKNGDLIYDRGSDGVVYTDTRRGDKPVRTKPSK